jgi:hypothetical protein
MTEAWRQQSPPHFDETGLRLGKNKQLDEVTNTNRGYEQQDDGFDCAHAESLQGKKEQDVESRDDDRPEERDMKQQIKRDGAPKDFGQVARTNG